MVARFETAALLLAARVVGTAGIARSLIALRRLRGCILRGGKIAAALWASTTPASTASAPASSTPAITAAISAEILPAIIAVAAAWTRVFLRGVVLLSKILRSGGVRFRLALFRFALSCAIFIDLAVALSFYCGGAVVLVREIRMHGLFVRNSLLRSVVGAKRRCVIGAVRVG